MYLESKGKEMWQVLNLMCSFVKSFDKYIHLNPLL